jgi:hypothetical protein
MAVIVAVALLSGIAGAADEGPAEVPVRVRQSLATYLDTFKLGAEARGSLDAETGWSDAKQNLCLRLLMRLLSAPSAAATEWRTHAGRLEEALRSPDLFRDRLVRVDGRAVFVAPVKLPPDQAELHNRGSFDLVRIVADDGGIIDVITDAAPKSWKRWAAIEERSSAVGVAVSGLATGGANGPLPTAADPSRSEWPADPRRLLLVSPRVAWFPDTPLGRLGMDYGLFDKVVDGSKLLAADADAFYAMLSAVGRGTRAGIEKVATPIEDPIPLIDPRARWMESHRGDPVRLSGVARRAMRIAVDDPARRVELGSDHYWELYVFLPTPTIQIGKTIQDSFPVVCCVRSLPSDMPFGDSMSEWVEVDGFAMKQYAYSLPGDDKEKDDSGKVDAGKAGRGAKERRETPLFIGRQAVWKPAPSTKDLTSTLGWVFMGLAATLAIAMMLAAWSMARKSGRRNREALPDRVEIE